MDDEMSDKKWSDRRFMAKFEFPCRGCGQPSATIYCDSCCDDAVCPHKQKLAECDRCDIEADFAFDAARESQ